VLEIVERILAALIILALLTLLIILAFPVPPRDTVAPTPSANGKQAAERTDPAPTTATPPPTPTKAPETTRPAEKAAETKPVEAAKPKTAPDKVAEATPPPVKKTNERLRESKEVVVVPAPPADPNRTITVRAKNPTVVVEETVERVEPVRRRHIHAARREPAPARPRPWREPVIAGECDDEDCGRATCCGCDPKSVPFWARPRRERYAQLPPGVCPE
jgi:hypothetical protein